jgi:hypothetical protein
MSASITTDRLYIHSSSSGCKVPAMSDRKENAPTDVKVIKRGKNIAAAFAFAMAALVYFTGGSEYLITIFVAVGCLGIELPIVSTIRAIRGKNDS